LKLKGRNLRETCKKALESSKLKEKCREKIFRHKHEDVNGSKMTQRRQNHTS